MTDACAHALVNEEDVVVGAKLWRLSRTPPPPPCSCAQSGGRVAEQQLAAAALEPAQHDVVTCGRAAPRVIPERGAVRQPPTRHAHRRIRADAAAEQRALQRARLHRGGRGAAR